MLREKRVQICAQIMTIIACAAIFQACVFCIPANAQCAGVSAAQPITVDDEITNNPNSRQLVNGTNSVVDTSTPGQIKIDVTGGGSGVGSVNPGIETTIGGTGSAPTVNVQFAINPTLTTSTSLAAGSIYPCNTTGGAFTVTLPDATAAGNKGAHIVVFLRAAGNTLSVATTSSQLINGQSAPISVANTNTFLLFIADGTNWQCVPMQPATGQTTNQWVAYIDALGVQHTAQIAFSNLSGSVAAAQMLALSSGQIYVGNSSSQPVATTPTAGTGLSLSAGSGSLGYSLSTPVSVANGGTGTSSTPSSGQLLIGTSGGGYSVAALTAGSNVTITNSSGGISIASSGSGGVNSVNAGIETTIGGTGSAPTVNVQFAISSTLTANTSLVSGTLYPCSTSTAAFTVTLPDATASGNKGAHIIVFLKTAGHALSIATTSSQLINGQSAPISVSNANTFLLFIADGTNWQCVPMQPATGQTTNQWVAYIDALGVQHTAQVAFSNLSGSVAAAQMLALSSGQIYVGNSSSQPVATTPTAGTGLSLSAGSGSLSYSLSTPVSVANGGSGTATTPSSGQLLIGTSGGGYSVAALTAGSNVTITNSSGGISIASSGGGGFTYTAESSSFTAAVGNCYEVTATATCTLPTASGNSGKEIMVWFNSSSGSLTFNTTSSQTMSGIASGSLTTSTQYDLYRFISDGSNWIIE